MPSYNDYRQFCNLSFANTFQALHKEIKSNEIRNILKQLYGHPGNVDIWVGGVAEDSVANSKVGPTFSCLLVDQFRRLRAGDRFWYQNLEIFTAEQVQEFEKTSLARIICSNTNISKVTSDVFVIPQQQFWTDCKTLKDIDLSKWQNDNPTNCNHDNDTEDDNDIPYHILAKLRGRKKRFVTNSLKCHKDFNNTIGRTTN